ncbi:unnamed protein product [Linum trigynum]|uniref:Uncharacterized protein n=1 Tax=Linum trigynum TaxID=586398 RepID=A0AAV2GXG7_9ROSI
MILNGLLYKLELNDEEVSSSCSKNIHFCPSHFPCSSSRLWRHVSLRWLNGNSSLMACTEHVVIKVVFQGLTLEN